MFGRRIGGKPGKAGKELVDPVQPPVTGRRVGGGAIQKTYTTPGLDPIAATQMLAVFLSTSLVSPAASGRFRGGDKGAMENRIGTDIGPLQDFRGKALIGRGIVDRLGMQGGPGAQPAFPSTGETGAPTIRNSLSGMDLPGILRTRT